MPKIRTQDKEVTLEKAMMCFWEKGYDGASIGSLEACTGVNRKQLFRDFDNKKGLFIEGLKMFTGVAGRRLLEPMEQSGASLQQINNTLCSIAAQAAHPVARSGCLLCNTSTEYSVMCDDQVSQIINKFFTRIELAYVNALQGAWQNQEIRCDYTAIDALGKLMLTTHVGMLILVKSGRDEAFLNTIAELTIEQLNPKSRS